MREPDHEPRTYENSLTHVSLQGETLVVGLSVADPQAAVELCQLTLDGWSDRTKHGVLEIQVVSSDDGSTLARSVYLATGAHVCE